MDSPITYDHSNHPIVIVHFNGELSVDVYQAYLEQLEERLFLPTKHGHVLDYTHAATASMDMRQMQGLWVKKHFKKIEKESLGVSIVAPNLKDRFIYSTILLITKMPKRTWIVKTVDEGIQKIKDSANEMGIEL